MLDSPSSLWGLLGLVILWNSGAVSQVVVSTRNGPVRGYLSTTKYGPFYSFKNVRYGKALRLERPTEPDKWFNVEDAKQEREADCPQFPYYATQRSTNAAFGNEDCLVLDVHARKLPGRETPNQQQQLLPVLVYFHAGMFSHGSKDEYGPGFLLKDGDIVIVIPNYRLGILGFLSNEDSIIPGNFGLWDQQMALHWVSENIYQFGGDSSRITIAGHDAGGASVGFHILSPRSQGLFKAAISGSGTALDIWAITQDPKRIAVKVAESVQCSTRSNREMLACLKYRPLEDLLRSQETLVNVTFRPVIDAKSNESFIPDWPKNLYEKGFHMNIPYLAGVTENEASVEVLRDFQEAIKEKHLDKIIMYFLSRYLPTNSNLESIAKAAKYHYLRGLNIPDFMSVAPKIIEMMSDFLYKSTLEQTLKHHSLRNQNTRMYVFSFIGPKRSLGNVFVPDVSSGNLGVSHMEDAIYLFNTTFANWIAEDATTAKMVDTITKIWRTFIALRPFGQAWKQFNSSNNLNYVELLPNGPRPLVNYRRNDTDFWTYLVPDLQSVTNSSIEMHSQDSKYQSATYGLTGLAILLVVLCVGLVGAVFVTRRKFARSSLMPVSNSQDMSAKYSKI